MITILIVIGCIIAHLAIGGLLVSMASFSEDVKDEMIRLKIFLMIIWEVIVPLLVIVALPSWLYRQADQTGYKKKMRAKERDKINQE